MNRNLRIVLAITLLAFAALVFFSGAVSNLLSGLIGERTADAIIKKGLQSPGSYRAIRQDVLWSKQIADETAYIVRTEYDAQNGFGAMVRSCQYVSFVNKGDTSSWNPLKNIQPCSDDRDAAVYRF